MSEQLAIRRATYGWLAWLASIGFGDPDFELVRERCPLPVALIDLHARRTIALTPPMVALLGLPNGGSSPLDLHLLVDDPSLLDGLLDMLIDGRIDAHESHRPLCRTGGESLDVRTWTVVTGEDRLRALYVVAPVGEAARSYLPAPVAAPGLETNPPAGAVTGLPDFSIRQLEVLRHLIRGERVPGIAKSMSVSQSTVRNHLSEMFRKVGVHSQEDLLALLRNPDPDSNR